MNNYAKTNRHPRRVPLWLALLLLMLLIAGGVWVLRRQAEEPLAPSGNTVVEQIPFGQLNHLDNRRDRVECDTVSFDFSMQQGFGRRTMNWDYHPPNGQDRMLEAALRVLINNPDYADQTGVDSATVKKLREAHGKIESAFSAERSSLLLLFDECQASNDSTAKRKALGDACVALAAKLKPLFDSTMSTAHDSLTAKQIDELIATAPRYRRPPFRLFGPATKPASPATKPAGPATKPARLATRPAAPATKPARPTTKPAAPATTTTPAAAPALTNLVPAPAPALLPASAPATQP